MAKRDKQQKKKDPNAVLAKNRKASHEFHLLQKLEAGIVLFGAEVKSAREGRVSLKESYGRIKNGELFLINAHFSPYTHARQEIDPVRPRKLLLHAREIAKLTKEVTVSGMTLVPTQLYLKNGKIKIEIALAKGKQLHDKRDSLRKKQADREMARARGSRGLD